MKIIGTDSDGLAADVGEGIFGFGTPDGSLGRSAFMAPKEYANRARQGIFWQPYSFKNYEAAQPELQWSVLDRPGLPLFPGSTGHGPVLIGPAMGSVAMIAGGAAVVGLAALALVGLTYILNK